MARTIERSKPPYEQVADDLRAEIAAGTLKLGDMLPSERVLAEEYGISRATATKAVASLRSQGLVESVVGVGTRVTERGRPRTKTPLDRYRSVERTRRVRVKGETSTIETGIVDPPDHVRRELRLDEQGSRVVYRSRITRDDNNNVVELSKSWFDAEWLSSCPDLIEREPIEEGTTAYVARRRGVDVGPAREVLTAVPAGNDAPLFDVDESAPILRTEVTILDHDRAPLTYEVYRYPPGHRAEYREERVRVGTADRA
jgi:DNA-binding GntR family transcriptional regulator